ncbi:MAG TPA: lantibiotic dehydratase, partial [Thermoanaerobaculia bacterium]|nr:lantibiotic dehydratase [Thermoanaerobaculia bacterium]
MKEIPPRVRLALLRVATLPFDRLAPLALPPEAMAAWQQVLDLEAALLKEMDPLSDALHAAAGEPTGGGPPEAARGRLAVIHLRRALHNRRPVAARLLAEAGAALPPKLAEGVLGHLQRRAELAALETGAVGAHQAGLLAARRALLDLVRLPLFREAVRLVSRSLLERLETLERRDPGRWRHDERHAAAKLTAYAARFATKTSPNSLFCATALAWVGGDEARLVGENHLHRLEILLSVAEARKVSACLGTDPAAWPAVVPRVNPTLRPEGPGGSGSLLFWRPASPRRDDDNEILSRVRRQPVLDAFLAEAGRETLAVPALLAAVAERTGIDLATLTPFFQQLLDRGVLLAELEPPYQSRRPLAWVASKLRSAGGSASWLAAVESFEEDVAALPSLAAEERLPAYDALEARFATFPRQRPLKSDELFRLDAASGLQVTLPARVWTDLEAPLRRYVRLFAGFYPERAFRAAWADRFLTRHPADTDVPLLDLYHGLFEPEARERPAAFPPPPPGVDAAARVLDRARELFADRASEAQATGTPEVALSEADWEHLLGDLPEPVWTAGALLQVA